MATQPPGTGVALFNPQAGAPAHIANFFGAEGTNIQARTTVPSLTPEGKMWTIAIDGTKTPLQRRNMDGDLEPLPIFKGVILDYAKQRGRAYYEGEYDPKNASAPICWSDDGDAPSDTLPGPFAAGTQVEPGKSRKISAKCASCPMAVKGSKVTPQGKAVSACGQHRMLAVLPDPAMQLPTQLMKPLRLKIAMTSDWDKQSPDQEQQGWLAFSNYVDWLAGRGVQHTASLVTKLKFDPDAAYPKIFFSAERYLEANELAMVQPLLHADETKKLLGGTWTPAGPDGVPVDQQVTAQPVGAEPVAAQPAAAQPAVQAAAAPPAQPAPAANGSGPAGYQMSPTETFTYEQYLAGGWTDEQLITNGKLIAIKAPEPAPQVVAAPTPAAPPAPVAQPAPAVVAGAVVVDSVVVAETAAPSPALSAPAAVVEQAPAQATVPDPVAVAPSPEPPAAAQAAAGVTAEVSTDLPPELADMMAQWG